MALITRSKRESPNGSVSLLPPEIRSTQRTKRYFNYAATVAITILVILGIVTVMLRLQIAGQERTLDEQQAKRASLQTQVNSLREFEVLEASLNQSRAMLATALVGDISATRFLDDLDSNTPDDAVLANVSVALAGAVTPQGETSLGTVQYSGSVGTFPGLANWLDTMSEIEGQRFVYLSNGSRGDAGVTFSATSHLTEAMLSGRCQGEGSPCP